METIEETTAEGATALLDGDGMALAELESGPKLPAEFLIPQALAHLAHVPAHRALDLWLYLIQEARFFHENEWPTDSDGFQFITVEKLAKYMGYVPVKSELKAMLSSLRKAEIAFNLLNKDGEDEYGEAGFVSEFRVTTKKVRFILPVFVQKLIKGIASDQEKAMFVSVKRELYASLTSKYEKYLYVLCKDYVGVGNTPKMTVDGFRRYMGIKDGEYQEFKKLNARVIAGPLRTINESKISDITAELMPEKQGRNIVGLHFKVQYKKQTVIQFEDMGEQPFELAKEPIPPKVQERYLKLRTPKEIYYCIARGNEYGESLEKKTKKPVNYGSIYNSAVTEGWHVQYMARLEREKEERKKKEEEARAQAERKNAEEAERRRKEESKKDAFEKFQAMSDEEKALIISDFMEESSDMEKGLFAKKGPECLPFRIFIGARLSDVKWPRVPGE